MSFRSTLLGASLGAGAVIAALALDFHSSGLWKAGTSGMAGDPVPGQAPAGSGSTGADGTMGASVVSGGIASGGIVSGARAAGTKPAGQPQSLPQRLEASELTIVGKDGTRHVFTVEMARTPKEQEIGMMFRRSVEPDTGMLFPFAQPRQASFWMYNTYIPLDLIFIDEQGRIESIVANAAPHSLTPRQSRGEVVAVLEIAGGRAAELGLAAGDKVVHPELPRP